MYNQYYATGKSTQIAETVSGGFVLEFNPNIKQWRINHASGDIPMSLMGYSPHPSVLRREVHTFLKKMKKRKGSRNR